MAILKNDGTKDYEVLLKHLEQFLKRESIASISFNAIGFIKNQTPKNR